MTPQSTPTPDPAPSRAAGIAWKTAVIIIAVLSLAIPLSVVGGIVGAEARYTSDSQTGALPTDIDSIRIDTKRAAIDVRNSSDVRGRTMPDEAQVTGWFEAKYRHVRRDTSSAQPVKIRREGTTAVIEATDVGGRGSDITIGIPKDLAEKLSLDLAVRGGSIHVDGAYKSVKAAVDGGSVSVPGETPALDVDVKKGSAHLDGTYDTAQLAVDKGSVESDQAVIRDKLTADVKLGSADIELSPGAQPKNGVDLSVGAGSAELTVPRKGAVDGGRDYVIVDGGRINPQTTIDIDAGRVAGESEAGGRVPLRILNEGGSLDIGYGD